MSRYKGNEDTCLVCGLKYRSLRTGYTYAEVRMLLWVGDPDYSKWKYKRRNTVLGLWWSIKQSLWKQHLIECEQMVMWAEAQAKYGEEFEELVDIVTKEFGGEPPEVDEEVDLSDIPF